MNVKYVNKEAFQVAGKTIKTKNIEGQNNQEIPQFWTEVNKNQKMQKKWQSLDNHKNVMYGICIDNLEDETDPNVFAYAIGAPYSGGEKFDFELIDIPATEWAIFPCTGPMPQAIQKIWVEIFTDWLPNNGKYKIAPLPQIEYYPQGDPSEKNYYSEVWIPVVKL